MQKTTTKATHRGIEISVLSERIGYHTMYACKNARSNKAASDQWFPTQGEAIAHERHEIDRLLE